MSTGGHTLAAVDDLPAFFAARLDEDEAAAKAAESAFSMDKAAPRRARSPWIAAGSLLLAAQPDGSHGDIAEVIDYGLNEVLEHAARHDPARVLRDVEADRALLGALSRAAEEMRDPRFDPAESSCSHTAGEYDGLLLAVKIRAARFVPHPDYRDEWKP